ncbi:MAG: T9SS type A sorting domain-containing protein, partial [Flavobacteriaceae bacterium]|nr:T9SS type A sorting domain-containing protein [Flavobacteriaceae bacterium]
TGNTSIDVIDTTDPISIPAGGFKIYGNQSSITLDTDDVLNSDSFTIYPNPANDSFQINKNIQSLRVFGITGKLITDYRDDFRKGKSFDASNLLPGIYIVEIENELGHRATAKLVKN